jgi:large subunit ribosomal protein L16
MLQPKKTKFRKQFKGRIHGVAKGGFDLNFGEFGLKALNRTRHRAPDRGGPPRDHPSMKRAGRVWIRVFPDVPVSEEADRSPHG